jgi:hypothetical protein
VAEAAAARVDDVLPVQEQLHELLGFPATVEAGLLEARREAARKGGRPPGARNKRLDEIARQVRERFGDVLLQQVAVATMPVADLMALGLKPLEAMQERRLSAATVLPYLEQRKPLAVDVTGRSVVFLDIHVGAGEGEQDQGVVDGLVVQLDGAELDAARNPLGSLANAAGGQLIADQAGRASSAAAPRARSAAQPHEAAAARATPGGGGFRPVAHSPAPASVVSPDGELFEATQTKNPTASGKGERG